MQEASDDVANDAADLDALYAAAKVVASVENGGELSTAGIVDVLVMFLRSKDCKLYEEAIKELIKLLAKREVGYEESPEDSRSVQESSVSREGRGTFEEDVYEPPPDAVSG